MVIKGSLEREQNEYIIWYDRTEHDRIVYIGVCFNISKEVYCDWDMERNGKWCSRDYYYEVSDQ